MHHLLIRTPLLVRAIDIANKALNAPLADKNASFSKKLIS
jgi:hypothetical protein